MKTCRKLCIVDALQPDSGSMGAVMDRIRQVPPGHQLALVDSTDSRYAHLACSCMPGNFIYILHYIITIYLVFLQAQYAQVHPSTLKYRQAGLAPFRT